MTFEIRYKDTDPDTGKVIEDTKVASCDNQYTARWVMKSLVLSMLEAGEPNREIYSMPDLEDWPIH